VILTDPIVESKMDDALAQIQALPAIRGEIVHDCINTNSSAT
jgi:homoserine dehydrogenase